MRPYLLGLIGFFSLKIAGTGVTLLFFVASRQCVQTTLFWQKRKLHNIYFFQNLICVLLGTLMASIFIVSKDRRLEEGWISDSPEDSIPKPRASASFSESFLLGG